MAITSNYQLPYPEPSDPVNVAEDIELLAKKIDTDLKEVVQDTVGGMVSSNTESGISVTYNDDLGKLNFNVTVIPTQTENEGKYLTTNGTTVNWQTIDEVPDQVGSEGKYLTTDGIDASWSDVDGIVPTGGATGQILVKLTEDDYDATWIDNFAQSVELYVKNLTGAKLGFGRAVYVSGSDGSTPLVSLSDADTEADSGKTIGLLKDSILDGDYGYVVTEGVIKDVNTSGSTLGQSVWLSSTPGQYVFGSPPAKPAYPVFLGFVIRVDNNYGQIYVKVQNGYELEDLYNVEISEPENNQILAYDSTTSSWKNVTSSETGFVEGDGISIDINEISVDSTIARLDSSPTFTGTVSTSGIVNAQLKNALVASGFNSASGNFAQDSRVIMTATATGSTAPTTRPDGTSLVVGDIWISF
jgi:hypothetical protein